jgi:TetR/AcrR family acrAB operon transcriptional repressor
VANAAHVTRGAIYWHFKSKADLYNTLIRELSTRGAAVVQSAVAEGGTLLEILRRVFVRQCALIEADREARAVMELALFKTGLNPELRSGRREQIEAGGKLIEQLAEAIRAGVARGELRADIDPANTARAFIAFETGAIQLWLAAPRSFSLGASAPAFADLFVEGIRFRPA